jgi:hypothetical protein
MGIAAKKELESGLRNFQLRLVIKVSSCQKEAVCHRGHCASQERAFVAYVCSN